MGPYEAEQQQEDGRGSHPGETATEDGVMASGRGSERVLGRSWSRETEMEDGEGVPGEGDGRRVRPSDSELQVINASA